jgi:dolichol-phosphate mannosyltransferase
VVPERDSVLKGLTLITIDKKIKGLILLSGKAFSDGAVRALLFLLFGAVADFTFFTILVLHGVTPAKSVVFSFLPALFSYFRVFPHGLLKGIADDGKARIALFWGTSLTAIFLRGGVFATAIDTGCSPHATILLVAGITVIHNYLAILFVHLLQTEGVSQNPMERWRVLAIGTIGYMLILRLCYLGQVELLPQEAYYWNYARHLDFGYLDHPPMVAWIISLGTFLFGDTEFAVRWGAFSLWMVTAYFSFHLTRNLFDRAAAFGVLLLLSVLPFFGAVGFLMTPDAPLVVCWAGALYFLERGLIGRQRLAWWGTGVCLGLGMLSKYTIALLVPSALVFILIDRESRHWLLRPGPYFAILTAGILFLPVILWNAQHEWVSFVFQGTRRLQEGLDFTLAELIGSVLVLLTPVGAIAAFSKIFALKGGKEVEILGRRESLFISIFTFCPFLVFFLFSLFRDAKLNWTGPVWLAVLPFIAWQMVSVSGAPYKRIEKFIQRAWPPTIFVTVLFWGAFLHFLVLGIPGLAYPRESDLISFIGWSNLAAQIEKIEDEIEKETGVEPLVIGMDKNKIASELAFYRNKWERVLGDKDEHEGFQRTTGRHIFGMESLMFKYWSPQMPRSPAGKQREMLILVSRELHEFKKEQIHAHGWAIGDIKELIVEKAGVPVGKYFYTIAIPLP